MSIDWPSTFKLTVRVLVQVAIVIALGFFAWRRAWVEVGVFGCLGELLNIRWHLDDARGRP